jgi:hypothetical protein
MNARASGERVYFAVAAGMLATNLVNLAAWAAGFHVSALVPLLWAAVFFALVPKPRAQTLVIAALFALFALIVLDAPVTDWDARSIWFFHAKRIFVDGSLYAQLDGYAGWSHNDYPTLVPALAASVARSFGYWNEILPRLAVLVALFPAFLVFGWLFADGALFAAWAAVTLYLSRAYLLTGYMDGILGLYCAAAVLLLAVVYAPAHDDSARSRLVPALWLLGLVTATLPLIKNEGLVAALITCLCLVPKMRRQPRLFVLPLLALAVYAVLWKIPVAQHGIRSDLFGPGMVERGWGRLTDPSALALIAVSALKHSWLVLAVVAVEFVRRGSSRAGTLVAIVFVGLYEAALIAVYLITPHELRWHLDTSADRTFSAVNLCLFSYAVQRLAEGRAAAARVEPRRSTLRR